MTVEYSINIFHDALLAFIEKGLWLYGFIVQSFPSKKKVNLIRTYRVTLLENVVYSHLIIPTKIS